MKINKLIERELTEAELFTIERFNYYFGGRFNFALIDTRTVVVIEKDGDVEQLEKEAPQYSRDHKSVPDQLQPRQITCHADRPAAAQPSARDQRIFPDVHPAGA